MIRGQAKCKGHLASAQRAGLKKGSPALRTRKDKIVDGIYVLIFFLILLLVLGAICGFLSLSKVQRLTRRFRRLETKMSSLSLGLQGKQETRPLQPATNAAGEEKGGNGALKRSS